MKLMLTVMCAVVVALGGCSIALQERPSKTSPVACSSSTTYATIDTVAGIAGMVAGGVALAYVEAKNHEPYVLPAGATLFAGWLGVESGIEGRRMASECERRVTGNVAQR